MLELLKTNTGEIKACLEWFVVNSQGHLDDKGEYVCIFDMEISPQYRSNGLLKEFFRIILPKVPQAKYGYFERRQRKYKDGRDKLPRLKLYSRNEWFKLLKTEAENVTKTLGNRI